MTCQNEGKVVFWHCDGWLASQSPRQKADYSVPIGMNYRGKQILLLQHPQTAGSAAASASTATVIRLSGKQLDLLEPLIELVEAVRGPETNVQQDHYRRCAE